MILASLSWSGMRLPPLKNYVIVISPARVVSCHCRFFKTFLEISLHRIVLINNKVCEKGYLHVDFLLLLLFHPHATINAIANVFILDVSLVLIGDVVLVDKTKEKGYQKKKKGTKKSLKKSQTLKTLKRDLHFLLRFT